MLQFETDLSSARIAEQQAFVGLRQLVGFNAMSASCKLQGQLDFQPLAGTMEEAEREAVRTRPDLEAARKGIDAARSQLALARANGKQDVNGSLSYSHTSGLNTTSFAFSVPLPIFNRNQGEIERARFAQTQAEFTTQATHDSVLKDVELAYEQAKANESIVDLYRSGYLDQAKQSRDISEFAFRQGAASLLDFLDAARNYRATEFAYHQALANYLLALHQLRQAQGFIK
jgi:cobalt-zinc-cadmium efflux system outer membrane protein